MKTNLVPRNRGSVLLVTLVITGILGFTLASYLTLISSQNRAVTRSQTWNATIPIAEAGIEEAIAHLNKNCLGNFILSGTTVDWNADGWHAIPDGIQKSNRLGNNFYIVKVMTNAPYTTNAPAIFSEGYVPALLAGKSSDVMFAAAGTPSQDQSVQYVGRKIRVTTGSEGVMAKGLVAKDSIDMKGNGVSTDSFDSDVPGMNINGQYHVSVRRANGDVAVNGSLTNSSVGTLGVQNANIHGHVAVGPKGSISVGSQGAVGDLDWNENHSGIQPGYARYDMNVDFPDVQVPFAGGTAPTGGYVTNETVTAISTTNTTTGYPTGSGVVYTNTTGTTTTTYPVSGTYIGSVITNTAYTVSASWPIAGTYVGVVSTNTITVTSSNVPTIGTYIGAVTTNTAYFTTTTYPSSPYGAVTTNYTWTTSGSYPAAGTYQPPVTTNYNGSGKKITGYSYNLKTGYTYQKITGYSCEKIDGFGCNKITGYSVAKISSYSLVQSTFTTNYTSQYYDYVLDSGNNYKIANLSGDVYVRTDSIIYVTDSLNMNEMRIAKNAHVKVYMGGASMGGNYFVNESGNADALWFYGLPSNTSISFHGNGGFCGVIYAPQASLTLGGGGNDNTDFIGASLTKTVKLNGHFNFHYDEALERKGPRRGYVIKSWSEIGLNETE
jgi:hypothetical protein